MNAIFEKTGAQLRDAMIRGEIRPSEVVDAHLKHIAAKDGEVRAFLGVDAEGARRQAAALEAKLARKEKPGLLFGLPVALKDNILRKGWEVTAGSKILKGFIAPYDATVTRRILEEDGIPIGRVNCDEFAMGSSCENSAYFPTRNPWDLARVPGGSSGGSAAAVAAGFAPMALGSDTGGSIRQPGALTGTVGLKPTYGRVSRYGLIAFASSLDQIGPMTRTVEDAHLLLQAIAGHDTKDSTSATSPLPIPMQAPAKGIRIGIPKEYFPSDLDPEIRAAVQAAIDFFVAEYGAKKVEVSLPHSEYGIAAYYLVATAEASSNLARFDGVRYGHRAKAENLNAMYGMTREQGFGAEVKRRILLGTYGLSSGYYDAYYKKALQVRTLLKRDFEKAFAQCDLVLGPTSPFPAFKIGEKVDDPLSMYLCDIFTVPVNLVGLPGISVPCGFTKDHLPIGLQMIGKPFAEGEILGAAAAYERKAKWFERRPAGFGGASDAAAGGR